MSIEMRTGTPNTSGIAYGSGEIDPFLGQDFCACFLANVVARGQICFL